MRGPVRRVHQCNNRNLSSILSDQRLTTGKGRMESVARASHKPPPGQ